MTDLPPPFPSAPPTLEVQPSSSVFLDTMNEASLDPQQLSGCFANPAYLGYYGCWRQGINVWMFYWPYGYGYSYCYVIGYADVGGWGRWEYEFNWQLCNQ